MHNSPHASTAILLLSGTLAFIGVGCSHNSLANRASAPTPLASSAPASPTPRTSPANQPSANTITPYERALDAAYSAAVITQSATSPEDWKLVANRWKEAIELLKSVPKSSPQHAIAQSKVAEYQRNLGYAQRRVTQPPTPPTPESDVAAVPQSSSRPLETLTPRITSPEPAPVTSAPEPPNERVIRAPIKRRLGRTPVIEIIFNDQHIFDMIVDSGASGTVITQAMANTLGVVPEGEIAATTASEKGAKFSVGRVESIAVGKAVVKDVPVAIAGPDLDIGLLGQDFLSQYNVSIKRDVVEFEIP